MTPTAEPVLEAAGLTKHFPVRKRGREALTRATRVVHAVDDVDLTLHRGQVTSLVGESGSGKSTVARLLAQLYPRTSGDIRLHGESTPLSTARGGRRFRAYCRRVQMIFQDPFASLNPRMNVGAAIAEPLLINSIASRSKARDKVADLLQRVGLQPDMASRYPHEFSGGQRQRICIARALAVEPRLIVADEAVSALDVSVKAQVVNLMLDLQARMGLGYLFISHDMAVVERVSHRVAVMYLGEIVEIGPREAIFGNPQHPYTKRLLSAVPIADPARRLQKRPVSNDEINSPVRAPDYEPPMRQYREVSPGHTVMIWGEEWEKKIPASAAA